MVTSTTYNFTPPKPSIRWTAAIFMPLITLIGFIGTPIYIYYNGLKLSEFLLFFFFFMATGLAITMGYHRFFSHTTYKANKIIEFLLLFFGAGTFQKSAIRWASQHRQHHQFTDTELDPHNSRKGFWYCHVGWIMFYKHNIDFNNVKDLQKSKLVMHQHKYYDLWSVSAGMILPMALGILIGHPLSTFLMAICLRLSLVLNAAFLINSYAHMIGSSEFDHKASAKDHWLGAVMTNGEGYHSFHHKFPTDYRNGYRWHHWDPTKWSIFILSKLGLAWDLKRTSDNNINAALKAS
jgi:stearoyl-CoA desaturase (delta-9 desaturase)